MLSTDPLTRAAPWWQAKPASRLVIGGGKPLVGSYPVSGAKNAVLPLLVAALLTPERVTLRNAPASLDVAVLAALLRRLGAELTWSEGEAGLSVEIVAERIHAAHVARDLVARMRASVLLLSVLLVRCGEAGLPLPGGDAIGRRGIDFHVDGLVKMGAEIDIEDSAIYATAPNGLHGAEIELPFPSVGATENLMIAAVGATGRSVIRNAAREPEIDDLAHFLIGMGARIGGIGSSTLTIEPAPRLAGTTHDVVPDRIEMGTLACAAALTDGELHLVNGRLDLLGGAAEILRAAGVELEPVAGGVIARRAPGGLRAVDVLTAPFPGFATDLQAPTMALLCAAPGTSRIEEAIFEQRFRHADQLGLMGADIAIAGNVATIRGGRLRGAAVAGTDVRATAALVIAALAAEGTSEVGGIDHLDRGYDGMQEKLRRCGADIVRVFAE